MAAEDCRPSSNGAVGNDIGRLNGRGAGSSTGGQFNGISSGSSVFRDRNILKRNLW